MYSHTYNQDVKRQVDFTFHILWIIQKCLLRLLHIINQILYSKNPINIYMYIENPKLDNNNYTNHPLSPPEQQLQTQNFE